MSGVGVVTIPCRNTLFPDSTTCTAVCASHHMVILHLRMLPLKLELPILLNVTLTRLVCSLLRLFCCLLHLLETLPREGLRHPERFLIGGQRRAQSLRDILVYHEISPLFSLGSATSCFRHQQREGICYEGWLRFPFNLDGVAEFEQDTSLTLWFRSKQHDPVPDT